MSPQPKLNKGYVPLPRAFYDSFFWSTLEDRKFTEVEAYLDLFRRASYATKIEKTSDGKMITVHRGEVWATYRFLVKRWGWSLNKVQHFIDTQCCASGLCRKRLEQGNTVVMLFGYAFGDECAETESQPQEVQANEKSNQEGGNGNVRKSW